MIAISQAGPLLPPDDERTLVTELAQRAVDYTTGTYAGLVRVCNDPGQRLLGMIAVVRAYRRRGSGKGPARRGVPSPARPGSRPGCGRGRRDQ